MTHLSAAQAVGLLDRTKWFLTSPADRLKLLERIQESILEEMEDLGVEEAEMKNMRMGIHATTAYDAISTSSTVHENLYTADACRLSAVIPLSFQVSSAIELYTALVNNQKPLQPVKITKVAPMAMKASTSPPTEIPQVETAQTGKTEEEEDTEMANEKDDETTDENDDDHQTEGQDTSESGDGDKKETKEDSSNTDNKNDTTIKIEGLANQQLTEAEMKMQCFDALVSPRTWSEKAFFGARWDRVRFQGDIDQARVGPYDHGEPLVTAILGAGNHGAAPEIIQSVFFDGHVVAYKPHPNNLEVDKIWGEILKPLVDAQALSFCLPEEGPELTQDPRVHQIYVTGKASTAEDIRQQLTENKKPVIAQVESVNPIIIVPPSERKNRLWTAKELRHQALHIASVAKYNGGHNCGRPQVIVTSDKWEQREAFLEALEEALEHTTPPEGLYYPGFQEVFQEFAAEYPEGKVIHPAETSAADFLLVKGEGEGSYGLQNEAFCQVLIEVPLDQSEDPEDFLPSAVKFCNEKIAGSLCATIIVDDTTLREYNLLVEQALTDLEFGVVSVNAMAGSGWYNPSLYWGPYVKPREPNEESDDDVKDDDQAFPRTHFGNLLGFSRPIKSIITDKFMSQGHYLVRARGAWDGKMRALSFYAIQNTWKHASNYSAKALKSTLARRDW